MSKEYPLEISNFQDLLLTLPAVTDVSSGIQSLTGLTGDDLRSVDFAHLPHAALRRTDGGLNNEVFVQIEFYLSPTAAGWRTLEFIAWFVRDRARGGEFLQLRPFALPPTAGERSQSGNTLRFHLDLFYPDSSGDLEPILAKVRQIGQGLKSAIEIYRSEIYI
jgi:hypothetical protein